MKYLVVRCMCRFHKGSKTWRYDDLCIGRKIGITVSDDSGSVPTLKEGMHTRIVYDRVHFGFYFPQEAEAIPEESCTPEVPPVDYSKYAI